MLLQKLADESALDLLVVVSGHVHQRSFRSDAPLLLDILCEVYGPLDPRALLEAEAPRPKDPVLEAQKAAARKQVGEHKLKQQA